MKLENYKARVSNEVESKEVQELFFELGYVWRGLGDKSDSLFFPINLTNYQIIAYKETMDMQVTGGDFKGAKELTIQQLRDLVAVKTKKVPYLVKTIDKWEEQQLTSDTPESATCLKVPDFANAAHAWRGSIFFTFLPDVAANTVWQRPTQPEDLPFIDDEPKMTDIEQTLNERQSQYGSFKDVADTTQSIYSMLLNDDMTDVEREALHMICSKLSRIKHGDCHKIDSWHDISGYATLVVKDLEQNNG